MNKHFFVALPYSTPNIISTPASSKTTTNTSKYRLFGRLDGLEEQWSIKSCFEGKVLVSEIK